MKNQLSGKIQNTNLFNKTILTAAIIIAAGFNANIANAEDNNFTYGPHGALINKNLIRERPTEEIKAPPPQVQEQVQRSFARPNENSDFQNKFSQSRNDDRRDFNRGNNNQRREERYENRQNNRNIWEDAPQQRREPQYEDRAQRRERHEDYRDYRDDSNRRFYPQYDANERRSFNFSNRYGQNYWGPNGQWQRWDNRWGNAQNYARRWGFDDYNEARGWRKGSRWYSHPSQWSQWGGWYSFFLGSNGLSGFSYNSYDPYYNNYGNDCVRLQSREWHRGNRAIISFIACDNGWGAWREIPNTRRFEGWTY